MTAGFWWIDSIFSEILLVSAIGLLVGGLDDLLLDFAYIVRSLRRRWRRLCPLTLADFPIDRCSARIAVIVPAWDESAVIGAMLRSTLARFEHPDWRLYVGAYPNDPATIDAIAQVAGDDERVRLVLTARPGPTTKADCLNALWRAATSDGQGEGRPFTAMVLHDAEDVVHPGELRVYDRMLHFADAVQLPVLPLPDPASRWVSGHYIDEFSEAHGRQMPVRAALRAGMPLAGVGCAISGAMLDRIAASRGGAPFDETSLTEDYELGLTVRALGGRGLFLRVLESAGGPPVAVRAYFPATLDSAIRQKARWITGITLTGWDRTGWQRGAGVQDHWMRMRDRRTILAIPVLMLAYLALLLWVTTAAIHAVAGSSPPLPDAPVRWLLWCNAALLAWRVSVRAVLVARNYGMWEAVRSVPRLLVGNYIALLAARRALVRYLRSLRGTALVWDKTAHHFPTAADLAGR